MNNIPEMLGIKETAKRTGLSYDYLRRLCLTNQIVFVRSGKKYLINIPRLADFLNTGGQNE